MKHKLRKPGVVSACLKPQVRPTYYFPPDDVNLDMLEFDAQTSICEWKGIAQAVAVAGISNAGWRYVEMFPAYLEIYQWLSFYPGKLICYIDDEVVQPQPGAYYGGWVTDAVVGPIKGGQGSEGMVTLRLKISARLRRWWVGPC